MKPNEPGQFLILEMTTNSVPDLILQILDIVSFCEDRNSQCSSCIASFRGLFDYKDDFIHYELVYSEIPFLSLTLDAPLGN